jgi:small subunit ribosomal protein S13
MARVVGVEIPGDKQIKVSLRYVYGVGEALSDEILRKAGITGEVRTKDLTEEELARISNAIEASYQIEGQLKRAVAQNIKRLIDIGCYRGVRHRKGLPVRGQRTKTNARTRKGPRKVVATKKSIKAMS